jgi:hypothetical protein
MKAILLLISLSLTIVACKTQPSKQSDASSTSDATASADAGVDGARAHALHTDAGPHYTKPAPVAPPPGARDVESAPPPVAKTPRPTDWSDAEDLLAHGSHPCSAVLKNEWVKVTCPDMASIALLGGTIDGVAIDVKTEDQKVENSEFSQRRHTGVAIFPLRRGDRRVLQFNAFRQGFQGGYGGEASPDEQAQGVTLSELWLDGDKGPRLELD